MKPKISLYISMTLDGYIARKNGSIDFLDQFNESGEDYGYTEFMKPIKNLIMGNTTYKQVGHTKEFEEFYRGKKIYVFSKSSQNDKDNIKFINEDVESFVNNLKGDTWIVGGANLLDEFLKKDLVDNFIISVLPLTLGDGIPLFAIRNKEKRLTLTNSKAFKSGIVNLYYDRK